MWRWTKTTQEAVDLTSLSCSSANIRSIFKSGPFLLHIIIPAYNESKGIIQVLTDLRKELPKLPPTHVTIIDDGSSDGTFALVERNIAELKEKDRLAHGFFQIVQNPKNMGKGQTLKRALKMAHNDEIVVFMDADGEHKPSDVPRLIRPIIKGKVDMVIGSRFIGDKNSKDNNGSYLKNKKQFAQIRKFGNNLFSFLTFLFYQRHITDTQCGFRAFAPNTLKVFNFRAEGFQIEMELTIEAFQRKFRVQEIPIDSGESTRKSNMKMIVDSLKIVFTIVEMRVRPKFRPRIRQILSLINRL